MTKKNKFSVQGSEREENHYLLCKEASAREAARTFLDNMMDEEGVEKIVGLTMSDKERLEEGQKDGD